MKVTPPAFRHTGIGRWLNKELPVGESSRDRKKIRSVSGDGGLKAGDNVAPLTCIVLKSTVQ